MRRKEIIGWFSMGRDNTGEDEEAHWKEMIEAKGQPRKRWHILSAVDYWYYKLGMFNVIYAINSVYKK